MVSIKKTKQIKKWHIQNVRISKTRRNKRRTHDKAEKQQLSTCPTGEAHLTHRAHSVDGVLYYRGKVVVDKK